MVLATAKHRHTVDLSLAEDILGAEFDVWRYDNCWHRVVSRQNRHRNPSVTFYVTLIELLNQTCSEGEVKFHSLAGDQCLCLVPVCEHGQRAVAVRILTPEKDDPWRLARKAANAAVQRQNRMTRLRRHLAESDSRLAAWATRIAQGNAELQWLHGLAMDAELSGTADGASDVARRILPEMCQLIRARSVVYLQEPPESGSDHQNLVSWHTGDVHVPESVCLSLIERVGRDADGPSAVRSFAVPAFANHGFAGVLSCIIKAVTTGSDRIGWILAINKDLQYLVQDDTIDRTSTAMQQECEFGTFESGLVEAAANAICAHARNRSLLREKESLFNGAIRSLVNAIDAKDSYTCGHSDRVAEYASTIASTMGLDDTFCRQIYMTGLLHDVGKIGVPDNVLQKPGRLTEEEFDKIKEHPVIGHQILQHLGEFDYVLPGVLHHHESVDGSGYPHGLVGSEIPLMARILAVADAYDAMTSDRPYRDGMPSRKAVQIIRDGAGQQWDEGCVQAFGNCLNGIRRTGHGGYSLQSSPL